MESNMNGDPILHGQTTLNGQTGLDAFMHRIKAICSASNIDFAVVEDDVRFWAEQIYTRLPATYDDIDKLCREYSSQALRLKLEAVVNNVLNCVEPRTDVVDALHQLISRTYGHEPGLMTMNHVFLIQLIV